VCGGWVNRKGWLLAPASLQRLGGQAGAGSQRAHVSQARTQAQGAEERRGGEEDMCVDVGGTQMGKTRAGRRGRRLNVG